MHRPVGLRALFLLAVAACSSQPPVAPGPHALVDGGAPPDAADAGVSSDAGSLSDAGPLPDAGLPVGISAGLNPVTGFGSNPGNLSMYLYVPPALPAHQVPVVVGLHGCSQYAAGFQGAGWNDVADEQGFVVIYPETDANLGCFMWWDPSQARRDQGQALSIKQMVDYVKSKLDVGDVFVTGVSGGGAMTVVMMASYPDVFSAGAEMAGVSYGCANSQLAVSSCNQLDQGFSPQQWADLIRGAASPPARWPRMAVWHGAKDLAVSPVNATEMVAGWTSVHGLSLTPTSIRTIGPATYSQFADSSGTVQVEEWLINTMGHGVALDPSHGCGVAGSFMNDVGLCSTRYAADFFFRNGPPPDAGTPWACAEFYGSNVDQVLGGRAKLCGALLTDACTIGSADDLGLYNIFQMSWVKETSPGYFAAGQCP